MNQIKKEIKENLREIRTDIAKNTADAQFYFPSNFIGFKGHFPDNPILPGICIVEALLVKLMIWQERPVRLKEMRNIKFFSPVRPDQILMFESKIEQEADSLFYIVNSKVTSDDRKIAQLKLEISVN